MKLRLEQRQRERRAEMESRGESHRARWFAKKEEDDGDQSSSVVAGVRWDFNGEYWRRRKEGKGFARDPELEGAHRLW